MWLQTGVLSDKQILKLLGEKIYIWPFNPANLKGSTYNLTASIFARSASGLRPLLVNKDREIEILAGETALIETEESIYVDKDICGTYHSKVKLVSEGLSHIGTTLDPCFFGTSLIAIHNHSSETRKIKVGATFASLMFHKMATSTRKLHDNQPFRSDIIDLQIKKSDLIYVTEEEDQAAIINEVNSWKEKQWRLNQDSLIEEVKNYKEKSQQKGKIKIIDLFFTIIIPLFIIALVLTILITEAVDTKYVPYLAAVSSFAFPLFSGIGNKITSWIKGE